MQPFGSSEGSRDHMSVVRGFRHKGEQEGAELAGDGRRPRKVSGIQKRAPKNPPACSVLNGQTVVFGNGEILLGPAAVGGGKRCLPITGVPGKWYGGREEVGWGRTSRRRRWIAQPGPM